MFLSNMRANSARAQNPRWPPTVIFLNTATDNFRTDCSQIINEKSFSTISEVLNSMR